MPVSSLYNLPAVLWVEDQLTYEYLFVLWGEPRIRILVAGSTDGVRSLVNHARAERHAHVFGLVDRDFAVSNRARWARRGRCPAIFIPAAHEIENYVIDADALAGCALNIRDRSPVDVRIRLERRAAQLTWWMACRAVIVRLRNVLTHDFPGHPSCDAVRSGEEAFEFIATTPWFADLAVRARRSATRSALRQRLRRANRRMAAWAANGQWQREFSGRELLRHVRDWVYPVVPGQSTGSARDSDVAKEVATWQVANGTVPPELNELRAAIRREVGLQ